MSHQTFGKSLGGSCNVVCMNLFLCNHSHMSDDYNILENHAFILLYERFSMLGTREMSSIYWEPLDVFCFFLNADWPFKQSESLADIEPEVFFSDACARVHSNRLWQKTISLQLCSAVKSPSYRNHKLKLDIDWRTPKNPVWQTKYTPSCSKDVQWK